MSVQKHKLTATLCLCVSISYSRVGSQEPLLFCENYFEATIVRMLCDDDYDDDDDDDDESNDRDENDDDVDENDDVENEGDCNDDDRFPNVIVPFTKTEKWERIQH